MTMEVMVGSSTVTVMEVLTLPTAAVMVAVPVATPVTVPEVSTLAVLSAELLQVTVPKLVLLLPSL